MKDDKFRLAVIGAGIFAEANIYPSLSTHFFDDIERLAICDLKAERAQRLAHKYGWPKTYTDFREMLSAEKPDGVAIVIGARQHPEVACQVLEMGYPIFLEKPSSMYLDGTLQILTAAEKSRLPVQVGHQKRYGLAYQRARQFIQDRENFGNVIQIESKMHGFTVFPTFYTCMLEWQCHNLDLMISFGGPIVEIEAKSLKTSPKTGALTAMLRFESGALGVLGWGTYGGPGQFSERIEVLGDQGRGVIITNGREVTTYDPEVGQTWTNDWNPISPNQSHVLNGYVGELRHFVDCIKAGVIPVPSIQDEAKTMQYLAEIARKADIPIEWGFVSSAL
jgi:myo-inositol 2-dehydrogenase / D-chiro-inositol 1-dehydrogenase